MRFLERELSGLPPLYQQAVLEQLEGVVRQTRNTVLEGSDKQALLLCARIFAILENAAKIQKTLDKDEE